jgi:prevent-host-death family protein
MPSLAKPLASKRKNPANSTRTMGAAKAKTHFLSVIDQVDQEGVPVTVTRRGKAIVQVVPIEQRPRDIFGCMKGTAWVTGDIVGPEPDIWEAMS